MPNLALPRIVQSDAVTYSPGQLVTIKKDFLEPALSMSAPCIRRMYLRGLLSITTAAGTTVPGKFLAQSILRFQMNDNSGPRINVNGGELRLIASNELGLSYLDPAPIAAAQGPISVEFFIPIVLTCSDKSSSPDDTSLVLPDFYSGGEISITFAPALILTAGNANLTVNSGSMSIIAEIVDEGTPEVKSRLSWVSTTLVNNDSSYPLNGKLRAAHLYTGMANEQAGTVWAVAGNTLSSNTLLYNQLPQLSFVERYVEESYINPSTDPVFNLFSLPLYVTHRGSKIVRQPVFNNIHVRFSQALPANNPTIVLGVFTQRSNSSIALTFRNASSAQIQSLVDNGGLIPGNSGAIPSPAMPESQRKYLPMRLGRVSATRSPTTPAGATTR